MKNTYKNKAYRLTRENAPLSLILASRHTQRFPLLWFDEETGVNKPLRYARNQKSPFQDEQDDTAILEPIVFENGFLSVPKNNQVLQRFLELHPGNGRIFVEVNKEKEAAEKNAALDLEVDALIEARGLSVKREILIFAKTAPKDFLNMIKDPALKLNAVIQSFFDKKLLTLRNNKKEIWYNTSSNKKKLMNVPYGEDPLFMAASFFESDDGIEMFKHLKSVVKNT